MRLCVRTLCLHCMLGCRVYDVYLGGSRERGERVFWLISQLEAHEVLSVHAINHTVAFCVCHIQGSTET